MSGWIYRCVECCCCCWCSVSLSISQRNAYCRDGCCAVIARIYLNSKSFSTWKREHTDEAQAKGSPRMDHQKQQQHVSFVTVTNNSVLMCLARIECGIYSFAFYVWHIWATIREHHQATTNNVYYMCEKFLIAICVDNNNQQHTSRWFDGAHVVYKLKVEY